MKLKLQSLAPVKIIPVLLNYKFFLALNDGLIEHTVKQLTQPTSCSLCKRSVEFLSLTTKASNLAW